MCDGQIECADGSDEATHTCINTGGRDKYYNIMLIKKVYKDD